MHFSSLYSLKPLWSCTTKPEYRLILLFSIVVIGLGLWVGVFVWSCESKITFTFLASRLPFGVTFDAGIISRINTAEEFLLILGAFSVILLHPDEIV